VREWLLALALISPAALAAAPKCAQIFYDSAPQTTPRYQHGRLYAAFLQNLLGHFPHIQQVVIPVEKYTAGQMEKCDANFYLGSFFDNPLPQAFLDDFATTKKPVLWAGYNIWRLDPLLLDKLLGVRYRGLSKLDWEAPDAQKRPGFYRFFSYKGETFEKKGEISPPGSHHFSGAYEMTLLDRVTEATSQVLSHATHSGTGATAAYLLRSENRWYLADNPFAEMSEADRYLIFCDVLFDVLDEKPRHPGPRPALVRFEDVHPQMRLVDLTAMSGVFETNKVDYGISLIPIFTDPLGQVIANPQDRYAKMTDKPEFIDYLKKAQTKGASLIWHGVTHQHGNTANPFNGSSGVDFEFWDKNRERPIVEDSPAYIVGRLEEGFTLFHQAGLKPSAWLAPHYQASPLDYRLFGQLFLWNIGRATYFPHTAVQAKQLPPLFTFDLSGVEYNGHRLPLLEDLKVTYPETMEPNGQFFPFEIYGDYYGQRLLPENVGNVQPYMSNQVFHLITIDDLLAHMKRNRVIRDAWGSFFVHAVLLRPIAEGGLAEYPGDTRPLDRLFKETKALGYEFIDLDKWTRKHLKMKRAEPIEVAP